MTIHRFQLTKVNMRTGMKDKKQERLKAKQGRRGEDHRKGHLTAPRWSFIFCARKKT